MRDHLAPIGISARVGRQSESRLHMNAMAEKTPDAA